MQGFSESGNISNVSGNNSLLFELMSHCVRWVCDFFFFFLLASEDLLEGTPQPVSVLQRPHSTEVFPRGQRELPVFQFVSVASHPGIGHHLEDPAFVLFTPSL